MRTKTKKTKQITQIVVSMLLVLTMVFMPMKMILAADAQSSSTPTQFVLVLDCSGSMEESDVNGLSPKAAKMFVDMMPVENAQIAVVAFGANWGEDSYVYPGDTTSNTYTSWVNMSEQEPSGPGSSEMKAKATTGTQGRYTGVPEYQLNLDISLALQKELENRGYRVVMARTDNDTAISNSERALKAYEEGGEIYVRIHANGSDDSSVNGALGMTPSYENPYVANLAEESYRLTECILNTYCNETGFNNLGIQYHDDMTGINWSKIPVMILEMGFMTNEHDDTAMQDTDMQAKMVSGIADGIDLYFGDSQ